MVLRENLRSTVAGFLGAIVVLGVLLWLVGFDRTVAVMAGARPSVLLAVALASLGWLLAWAMSLRTVLASLGIDIPASTAFLVFAAATFANNVTPFGQAGGEPFSALLIAEVSDEEYETGLAAIASVDALNFVPSVFLALVGLGFFAATVTLDDSLEVAAGALVVLMTAVSTIAYLVWRYRETVEHGAARIVTPLLALVARVIPGRSPPGRADVVARIDGFFATIDRIADDRRRLAQALGFSALGWLGLMCSLWLSLYAVLGHGVVFAAVMLAVPLGSIASITPLPGGLGGIETVLVAMLVPTTGLEATTIAAAVVLHRAASYWLPILVGGAAASALGSKSVPG